MKPLIHLETGALGAVGWTEYPTRFVLGGLVCLSWLRWREHGGRHRHTR